MAKKKNEIIQSQGLSALMHTGNGITSPFQRDIYLGWATIVGMRFRGGAKGLVRSLKKGSHITLVREPEKEYDSNAILAIDEKERKIGYVSRQENRIPAALMDAGKTLYGVVQHNEDTSDDALPWGIYIDLFMREFAAPEDRFVLAPQGAKASYAVIACRTGLDPKGKRRIESLFSIKVIHGEERECFSRTLLPESSREEERSMMADFDDFNGFIPLVGHEITGRDGIVKLLQESYGVLLGKALANHITDTREMAQNHLPDEKSYSLKALCQKLKLAVPEDDDLEETARAVWALYLYLDN